MTNQTTTIETNAHVQTPKHGTGTVEAAKSGWLHVRLDDSGNVRKYRAKQLSVVSDDDNPDGKARIRPDWGSLQVVKAKSGKRSYDNGDAVAVALRGKSLEETAAIVAKALTEDHDEPTTAKALLAKYSHLQCKNGAPNYGHMRMCIGNKLRAAIRRAS